MWKIVVAFVIFAALTMYVLSKGGDIDMSGEKHGIDAGHDAKPAATAPADAASAPASEAK